MAWTSLAHVRPLGQLSSTPAQHAAVAACFAASLFLGNFAYLGLSVAFINMLKALTPVATLAASLVLGLESLSPVLVLSTALIAVGTSTATAQVGPELLLLLGGAAGVRVDWEGEWEVSGALCVAKSSPSRVAVCESPGTVVATARPRVFSKIPRPRPTAARR